VEANAYGGLDISREAQRAMVSRARKLQQGFLR
jgi:hypothetical protein